LGHEGLDIFTEIPANDTFIATASISQATPIALGYITDNFLTTVTKPVSLRIFTTVGASVCARCKRPVDVDAVSKIVVVDATVLLAALLLVPVITILLLARLLTVVVPKPPRPTPST
jgi:hypothetical protein